MTRYYCQVNRIDLGQIQWHEGIPNVWASDKNMMYFGVDKQ